MAAAGPFRSSTWLLAISAACLLAACSAAAPPTASLAADRPIVVIQQSANGASVPSRVEVSVAGTATDAVGVDRVVLFVDGVSFASTPAGAPAQTLPFTLVWPAGNEGPHSLQVVAYRSDGTPSDPAVIEVIVGGSATGAPVTSIGSLPPFPSLSTSTSGPILITPGPTQRPPMTLPPATAQTSPTPTPPVATETTKLPPTEPPTAPPSPMLTPDLNGFAPDDTTLEPHAIVLSDCVVQVCPEGVVAMGSVTEHISAPGGDILDQLYFAPAASVSYKIELTSCSDTSDMMEWRPAASVDTLVTGCGDWLVLQMPSLPPAQSFINVGFGPALAGQRYNAYVYTVYQLAQ
jgi:hypothetical protein